MASRRRLSLDPSTWKKDGADPAAMLRQFREMVDDLDNLDTTALEKVFPPATGFLKARYVDVAALLGHLCGIIKSAQLHPNERSRIRKTIAAGHLDGFLVAMLVSGAVLWKVENVKKEW